MKKFIQVRTDSDYKICHAIRKKVFIEEQKISEELEIDEYEKVSVHCLVFVNDEPVATGRLRKKDQWVKFERIAVLKNWRGKKIGSFLLKNMLFLSKKLFPGYCPMLHAQMHSFGFYKKNHWKGLGDRFFEAGIEHQMMIYQH